MLNIKSRIRYEDAESEKKVVAAEAGRGIKKTGGTKFSVAVIFIVVSVISLVFINSLIVDMASNIISETTNSLRGQIALKGNETSEEHWNSTSSVKPQLQLSNENTSVPANDAIDPGSTSSLEQIVAAIVTSDETNIPSQGPTCHNFLSSPSPSNMPTNTKEKIPLPSLNPSTGNNGLKKCQNRDVSNFSPFRVGDLHRTSISTHLEGSNCLFYDCNRDASQCDNDLQINFDGPNPPCCTHILRDMARIFDETMCSLGLDYAAAFGTLLGFRRADRLIPWTADNDYIIPSKDVANAMVSLWDSKKTGMAHIFQGINRMCVTPDFAGGELQRKWGRLDPPGHKQNLDWSGLPYIDFYLGRSVDSTAFGTIGPCHHLYSDVFPTKREFVYSNTFAQNFPANPDQLLRTFYGKDWKRPLDDKDPHGHAGPCPYGPTY